MAKSTAVLAPNLGLYLDRPELSIDKRALSACRNIRIKNGRVERQNMGWDKFLASALNGAVTGIDNFFLRSGSQTLIFATTKDLYQYDETDESVSFITPRYETGTVAVTNGSATVTGTGTTWSTNLKAGDQIFVGATAKVDPSATWYTIDSVDSDTAITLTATYAGSTATGQSYTGRKLFTGDIFDWWSFETFPNAQAVTSGSDGDRWYATNGVDDIVAWDGSTDQVYTPYTFKARVLVRFKNMLLFGSIVESGGAQKPFTIINSAIGEPENTTTDEAAETEASDGVDPIVVLMPLGDTLVIYGSRSIVLAQFVGGDTLFVFRTAVSGIGPISGRAVSDFGDRHEFIGPDTQYRFDGITVEEIGGHVWREILRKQSPKRFELFISHFDEENGELLWGVPLTSDADTTDGPIETAWVEHYLEEVGERHPTPFSERDWTATATGYFERIDTLTFNEIAETWETLAFRWNDRFFEAAFPFNLFGDADGNVYTLGTSDAQDGTTITAFARFPRRACVDGRAKGIVKRVYPFAERYTGEESDLTVRLYGADQAAGPLTSLGDFTYDLSQATSKFFVSPRKAARYVAVEFRNSAIGAPWFIEGYDLDVVKGGER